VIPEEHLEDQESDVAQHDQADQRVGDRLHGVARGSPMAIAVIRSMNSPLALM
jgi:hypothetical protein